MRRLFQPVPPDRRVRRTAQLLIGLVLYGVTAAMMVLAGLGLDPWDVLHQGLSRTFGLGIGTWAILASFVVLLGWIPLRQRLGVGTIANAILVGVAIDVTLAIFDPPQRDVGPHRPAGRRRPRQRDRHRLLHRRRARPGSA